MCFSGLRVSTHVELSQATTIPRRLVAFGGTAASEVFRRNGSPAKCPGGRRIDVALQDGAYRSPLRYGFINACG